MDTDDLFLISNDRAFHSAGTATEKVLGPSMLSSCRTELKEDDPCTGVQLYNHYLNHIEPSKSTTVWNKFLTTLI